MSPVKPKHIAKYEQVIDKYPNLARATNVMPQPPADILGRDINELKRGLRNPEKANVVLLAEPGTGKTAYVQGFAYDKSVLEYYLTLEVNPERLIEKDGDRDNALLTGFNEMLDEASQYSQENNVILVLFIDEFHKMAEISPSLMESLKPRLEKSALHGFRLIAATTFQEYNESIAKNRALDQRFLQIKLAELPKSAVLHILRNRAKQNGVEDLLADGILEDIYDESKSILLSNAQPRASIDILNSMIGDTIKKERMKDGKLKKDFYTAEELGFNSEKVICRPLLKRIIRRTHGIDIDNEVNIVDVISALKTRLYNQDNAIELVTRNLEMAAQGFSELDRPKFSFLSSGPTGVGKTEMAKIISETMRIPLKRFDMSRYSNPADAGRFADDLFNAIWATPNAYLLLDEVEKSSTEAMNILLQVLDDARLADSVNPDRVASFSGTIINLTTNLGSEVYQHMAKHQSEDAEADVALVYKSLAESKNSTFNSAVLGRLDTIVPFHPLPASALFKIAERTLNDVIEIAETNKRRIIVSDDIIPYIVKDRTQSDTEQGGARDVKRNVKNIVVQVLAHYLTYAEDEVPVILFVRGTPRFKNKNVLDPLSAYVDIAECYSTEMVNSMLQQLSQRLNKPLLNEGLYLPKWKTIEEYGVEIANLALNGSFGFRSKIDGSDVIVVSR